MHHNVEELCESGCWTQWIPLCSKYDYQINFALTVWSLLHSSAHNHIDSEVYKTDQEIKCMLSHASLHLLPFLPMMKLTLAPRGTSSMV